MVRGDRKKIRRAVLTAKSNAVLGWVSFFWYVGMLAEPFFGVFPLWVMILLYSGTIFLVGLRALLTYLVYREPLFHSHEWHEIESKIYFKRIYNIKKNRKQKSNVYKLTRITLVYFVLLMITNAINVFILFETIYNFDIIQYINLFSIINLVLSLYRIVFGTRTWKLILAIGVQFKRR